MEIVENRSREGMDYGKWEAVARYGKWEESKLQEVERRKEQWEVRRRSKIHV